MIPRLRYSCRKVKSPFARLFLEGGGFWRGIGLSGTCCRGLAVERKVSFWGILVAHLLVSAWRLREDFWGSVSLECIGFGKMAGSMETYDGF